MIHRIESALRRLRRALSRDEWSWRLLKLSARTPEPGKSRQGLLLIQIDGLSAPQFEKAMRAGRMPFLRSLLNREGYHRHSLYSGIPSTTPAAQGELFYGRRCCVPAFAYRARMDGPQSGRVMTLLNSESADRIENELKEQGEPLLTGGSAYSNIFTGGAHEAHFCASRLSLLQVMRRFNPFALTIVVLWNGASVLRLTALLGIETALALYDAMRGRFARGEWRREFSFIFSRVLVCVGLREVVTAMASMDLARGMPVVHLNFPGFDEQAHRRGPGSAFANFALGGIDFCVRRLYRAAHRSVRREYEVLIYSDHGQESVLPYPRWRGETLSAAVQSALASPGSEATVLAYGPVGHFYLPKPCLPELRDRMAETLRVKAAIPMVLYAIRDGQGEIKQAKAFTSEGVFLLPRDAAAVLGAKHPFLAATARDLAVLCHHADAGDFVAVGWSPPGQGSRPASKTISFAWENGAHGGPGFEETHAFALLPRHLHVTSDPKGEPFRHEHLRALILSMRRQGDRRGDVGVRGIGSVTGASAGMPMAKPSSQPGCLTVVSYNVHACEGMDGRTSPERISRVLAQTRGEIFCLQECFGSERGFVPHQALRIAEILEHDFHWGPVHVMHDAYGNAILTALPMEEKRQAALPTVTGYTLEERGAQWAEIEWQDLRLQVLNTHLGLLGRERNLQAEALTDAAWVPAAMADGPVVLAGDFNAGVRSTPFQTLARLLVDAQESLKGHRPRNTFFAGLPVHRIDHVFMSRALRAEHIEVMRSHLTRLASDHLPVIVKLKAL